MTRESFGNLLAQVDEPQIEELRSQSVVNPKTTEIVTRVTIGTTDSAGMSDFVNNLTN